MKNKLHAVSEHISWFKIQDNVTTFWRTVIMLFFDQVKFFKTKFSTRNDVSTLNGAARVSETRRI